MVSADWRIGQCKGFYQGAISQSLLRIEELHVPKKLSGPAITERAKSDKFMHACAVLGEGGALDEGGLKVRDVVFSRVWNWASTVANHAGGSVSGPKFGEAQAHIRAVLRAKNDFSLAETSTLANSVLDPGPNFCLLSNLAGVPPAPSDIQSLRRQ